LRSFGTNDVDDHLVMKPSTKNYKLGCSANSTKTPPAFQWGLDASYYMHLPMESREKFFLDILFI